MRRFVMFALMVGIVTVPTPSGSHPGTHPAITGSIVAGYLAHCPSTSCGVWMQQNESNGCSQPPTVNDVDVSIRPVPSGMRPANSSQIVAHTLRFTASMGSQLVVVFVTSGCTVAYGVGDDGYNLYESGDLVRVPVGARWIVVTPGWGFNPVANLTWSLS